MLERSFLVPYRARETEKIHISRGKVTIFLALGILNLEYGLPRFGNGPPCQALGSGDAVLVRNDSLQISVKNGGGGFALVSDWNA